MMITSQLERLKNDHVELDYYIQRLQKEGREIEIPAMQKKQEFLMSMIEILKHEDKLKLAG